MWFVRWFLTLLVMIYAVIFAAFNLDPITLRIPWIPFYDTQPLSKAVVVLLAVALGMLLWAVVAFIGSIEFRRRIHQLERQNRDLKVELTSLRNRAILDDHELEGAEAPPAQSSAAGVLGLPHEDEDADDVFGDVTHVRNSER
jgi:uncharacterized integral membrane protein